MKKLPVWDLAVASFERVVGQFGYALRISGPWVVLLVLLAVVMAMHVAANPLLAPSDGTGTGAVLSGKAGLGYLLLALLQIVAQSLAMACIAVLWHRLILQGEMSHASFPIRLDRPVWLYFGYGLLIFLILVVPFLLGMGGIGALVMLTGEIRFIVGPLVLVLYLLLFVASLRLSLVLPAVAVGDAGFGLADAWRVTTGNGARLLGAVLLMLLGLLLLGVIAMVAVVLVSKVHGATASILSDLLNILLGIFGTLVLVTSLSLAYGHLVRDLPIER